jgi:hypothetical protein
VKSDKAISSYVWSGCCGILYHPIERLWIEIKRSPTAAAMTLHSYAVKNMYAGWLPVQWPTASIPGRVSPDSVVCDRWACCRGECGSGGQRDLSCSYSLLLAAGLISAWIMLFDQLVFWIISDRSLICAIFHFFRF